MSVIEELRELVFDGKVVLHGSPDLLEEIDIKDNGYDGIAISATIIPEVALYYALFRRLPGRMPNGGSWSFVEKESGYFIRLSITQERLNFVLSGSQFKGCVYVFEKKDFVPTGFEECRIDRRVDILRTIFVTDKDLPFELEYGKLEYFIPLPYLFPNQLTIKPLAK